MITKKREIINHQGTNKAKNILTDKKDFRKICQ